MRLVPGETSQWPVPSGRGCSLGSTTQLPLSTSLPKLLGAGGGRDFGAWESCWGGGLLSAEPSPGSGDGRCGKESEEQFSALFVIYAGQLWAAWPAPSSLNKRGLQTSRSRRGPWAVGRGCTSLAACASVCNSAFWLGTTEGHLFSSKVIQKLLRTTAPPDKWPTRSGAKDTCALGAAVSGRALGQQPARG